MFKKIWLFVKSFFVKEKPPIKLQKFNINLSELSTDKAKELIEKFMKKYREREDYKPEETPNPPEEEFFYFPVKALIHA